jgi:hypothetical protein
VTAADADRLVPAFPRFAQRVVDPPVTLGLVGPRWADIPGFDVGDHLRRVLLPATGGDDELHAQVSARADRPPDSARPLWRADLIDGYRTGCAVLLRTHHAIAGGTALVQVLLTLADRPADRSVSGAGGRAGAAGQHRRAAGAGEESLTWVPWSGGPVRFRGPQVAGLTRPPLELGCTGLFLGPVLGSPTHGYDTVDHLRVDRHGASTWPSPAPGSSRSRSRQSAVVGCQEGSGRAQ